MEPSKVSVTVKPVLSEDRLSTLGFELECEHVNFPFKETIEEVAEVLNNFDDILNESLEHRRQLADRFRDSFGELTSGDWNCMARVLDYITSAYRAWSTYPCVLDVVDDLPKILSGILEKSDSYPPAIHMAERCGMATAQFLGSVRAAEEWLRYSKAYVKEYGRRPTFGMSS